MLLAVGVHDVVVSCALSDANLAFHAHENLVMPIFALSKLLGVFLENDGIGIVFD